MRRFPHISTLMITLALALVAFVLYADASYAIADGTAGSFRCSNGHASGQLYNSGGSCPTSLNMGNVFSFLVCNMEQLSSNLMGHMYCGMIQELAPAVWAAATAAVLFFGISFTIGVIPATGRDAMLFLLKIAFITGFATNADLLIGVGYLFLIEGMKDGVNIVLAGLGGEYTSGNGIYGALDGFIATAFHFATDSVANAALPADRCKNAIFAVLAVMTLAFPILSYLGIMLLARIAITFLRAVFGYVYALVGVTFLLTLSPIFISFFLFKTTRSFFDKWIGYMASFAIQVVMLFAFLAFILSIPAQSLTSNLTDIIMYKEQINETTSFRFPWEYCTFCDFKIVDKTNPGVELTDKSPDFISNGRLQCREPKTAITATFAISPKPGSKELGSLLVLAGNGILALIVLAFIVEMLLGMLPGLAQTLARGLGATYAPPLGGQNLPGEPQITDFGRGFTHGMGVYDAKGNLNMTGNGPTSLIKGIKDGLATMISGRTNDGGSGAKDADATTGGLARSYPSLFGNTQNSQ